VLLIDDSPAMRTALRGLLQDAGFLVVGDAADGADGVAMAGRLQPDVVVTDLRLPTLDGVGVTRQLTGAFPHIQVVVFSVNDTHQSEQAARAAGAYAFLPKGCPPQDLCDTVLQAGQNGVARPPR